MGKLAASPAKMQKVLPPVFDKLAVSAGAYEVVVQDVRVEEDAVMEVARQLNTRHYRNTSTCGHWKPHSRRTA
ncbi:hypothetical protein PRIC1_002663 [Phytophthora ramorum]|uniref:uncharacterized protein n=1 Tax=Phytophthora ramorum TaxID=164328 RepID=UPI0030B52886|nr:hypothetical protein KRP23_782 [Phytophthora ramorum]